MNGLAHKFNDLYAKEMEIRALTEELASIHREEEDIQSEMRKPIALTTATTPERIALEGGDDE